MEDITDYADYTDADYAHAKRICKDFEIKDLGEYHEFYLQSDTALLNDVFEIFSNMCIKIYEPDLAKFVSVPGLTWHAVLKKNKVKKDLLTLFPRRYFGPNSHQGGGKITSPPPYLKSD